MARAVIVTDMLRGFDVKLPKKALSPRSHRTSIIIYYEDSPPLTCSPHLLAA